MLSLDAPHMVFKMFMSVSAESQDPALIWHEWERQKSMFSMEIDDPVCGSLAGRLRMVCMEVRERGDRNVTSPWGSAEGSSDVGPRLLLAGLFEDLHGVAEFDEIAEIHEGGLV